MLQHSSFFFNSGFWSGKFARAVLLFYWQGLSTKEEIFSKGYMAEAIFKRLDAFPNLCSQIPLSKGQTLPLILLSSHPSRLAPAANIILPVEIKACFSELYNQAVKIELSIREKSRLDER